MAKYCSTCGYENEDNATTCVSCGTNFPSLANNSPLPWGGNPKFLDGLIHLRNYTIVGFISLAVGLVMDFVLLRTFSYSYLIGPLGTTFGGGSVNVNNLNPGFVAYSNITIAVSSILTLIGLYYMFRGFTILKGIDMQFSLGRTGTILEFIGMSLVIIGTLALLATIVPIVGNGTTPPVNTSQINLGAIIGLAFLILFAAIILLVGVILAVIGLYRVGTQFDNSLVHVGAILSIFLGIVGIPLLYIGFTEIINQLRAKAQTAEANN